MCSDTAKIVHAQHSRRKAFALHKKPPDEFSGGSAFVINVHFNEAPPPELVMLSRHEASPGEAARALREEPRSTMARSLVNEFALGIFRGGSR